MSEPPRRAAWKLVVPISALLTVAIVVSLLLWKQEPRFEVTARVWSRSIDVEKYGPVKRAEWCDELPVGASVIARHSEQRRTREVPDGEDCRSEKTERSDGASVVQKLCSARFKQEPVYAAKCEFLVNAWSVTRSLRASGNASQQAPHWPLVELQRPGCVEVGCEREGPRRALYTVFFRAPDRGETSCDFDQATWRAFIEGERYIAVGASSGTAACRALSPAR
jgi:hypothetical protein